MVEHRAARLDGVFHALAHPTRRAILRRLARRGQTVAQLARPFRVSLEAVSQHVQVLEKAGLVSRRKAGRSFHCELDAAPLAPAATLLRELTQRWEQQLDSLERFLRETED